jgi:hypothetical protein
MSITRKELLQAGAAVVLSSCGSPGGSTPDAGNGHTGCPGAKGASATTISSNHGHTLTVPAEDIAAGIQKGYQIKGTADHDHVVIVQSADFIRLREGRSPEFELGASTTNNHSHKIVLVCG